MRSGLQTAQRTVSPLVILPINTERILVSLYGVTTSDRGQIDRLDAALIELLAAEPGWARSRPPGAGQAW